MVKSMTVVGKNLDFWVNKKQRAKKEEKLNEEIFINYSNVRKDKKKLKDISEFK